MSISPLPRARHIGPPFEIIVECDRMIGRSKNHRTGNKAFRRSARIILRARLSLSYGYISSRLYELLGLAIGDIGRVHEESVDVDAVYGPGIVRRLYADIIHVWRILRAHRELATRNPDHAWRRLGRRACRIGNGRPKRDFFHARRPLDAALDLMWHADRVVSRQRKARVPSPEWPMNAGRSRSTLRQRSQSPVLRSKAFCSPLCLLFVP